MKKILTALLSSLLLLTFSACTISKPAEPERRITVSGTGSVLVKPDMVSMNFIVKTTERSVDWAAQRNATLTKMVLESLQNNGISSDDISTYDYTIYQENQQTLPGRYSVENNISVLIRNIENTGKIIDGAIANGFTTLNSFEYLVSDKQSSLRQARTLAIQNAQDAANLLAGASGCKVNEVMNIVENYSSASTERVLFKSAMSAYDSAPTTPIEAGSVSISSSVTITYSLE